MNRRRSKRASVVCAVMLAAGLATSWLVAGWLVSPVPREIGTPPDDLPAESISLASDSCSTIAGWHIPAEESRGVIVLLHGIRGCRLSMVDRAKFLHKAGYSLVMIDLRCHGESPGEFITLGHLESHDVKSAVSFTQARHPTEPIAVIAVSLGGASTLLAAPLDVDALILESVFPDIASAVQNRVFDHLGVLAHLPSWLLLAQLEPRLGIKTKELRPIDRIGQFECPVFILSGVDDKHTTEDETRQIFRAAREPKQLWLVPDAAHVDLHQAAPRDYELKVLAFLEQHMPSSD